MSDKNQQLSLDDQAANLAESMFAKGGAAGDMPTGRGGNAGAEGGFTPDAGGQVIDAGGQDNGVSKGQTGAAMNSEPDAQNPQRHTGADMNSEPAGDNGSGGQPGEGGNLSQNADSKMRARKPGQIGVSGGSTGGGLSENEDAAMRARKAGKVGMSKAQAIELGLSQSQMELAEQMGLMKGCKKGVEIEIEGADDEEEGGEDEAEKGEVTVDDLNKSLDALEALAMGSAIPAPKERRAELAEKLNKGEMTQAEIQELADLMKAGGAEEAAEELIKSGDAEPETELEALEDLDKSFQEQFSEDDTMGEAYDASNFLERQSQLIAASMDTLAGAIRKSLTDQVSRRRPYDIALARSLKGIGQLAQQQTSLVKSLTERLERVENQPLPRRGVSGVQQLNKSMPNEAGAGAGPGRKQILDTLEGMARMRERSAGGERLDLAVTLFEQSGDISKSLYQEVVEEMRKSGNGVGIH